MRTSSGLYGWTQVGVLLALCMRTSRGILHFGFEHMTMHDSAGSMRQRSLPDAVREYAPGARPSTRTCLFHTPFLHRPPTGWDDHCANHDRQTFELTSQKETLFGGEGVCVDRHARLSFWKNPVPVSLRWMLAGEVVVNVRARFHKSLHDEQHPYRYTFEFPCLGNRLGLDVTGEQWLVPIDEGRCMIHARVNVTARLPAFSQQVEKELEKRTRIGYGLMNRLTMEYVKKKGARPQGADGGAKVAEIIERHDDRRRRTAAGCARGG